MDRWKVLIAVAVLCMVTVGMDYSETQVSAREVSQKVSLSANNCVPGTFKDDGAGKDMCLDGITQTLVSGTYNRANVTIQNGGILKHDAGGAGLTFIVSGTFEVLDTSKVDLTGLGYAGGALGTGGAKGTNVVGNMRGRPGAPGTAGYGFSGQGMDGGGTANTAAPDDAKESNDMCAGDPYTAGGGGGSGGKGGQAAPPAATGGTGGNRGVGSSYWNGIYPDTRPHYPGPGGAGPSGGGGGGDTSEMSDENTAGAAGTASGGAGGGYLNITTVNLIITGLILANGGNAGNGGGGGNSLNAPCGGGAGGGGHGGGGGSGGGIHLKATGSLTVNLGHVISARGGNGGNGGDGGTGRTTGTDTNGFIGSGGNGGNGGKIAVYYALLGGTDTLAPTANGGSGGTKGTVGLVGTATNGNPGNLGTVYIENSVPPSVLVTSPNGGEKWFLQGTYDIKYTANQGTFPLASNPITIYYSTTGSAGPWTQIATNLLNTGIYQWTVQGPASANSYVKVDAKDDRSMPNIGSDMSNATFNITSTIPPAVRVEYPNGGESFTIGTQIEIRWNATNGTYPLAQNPITTWFSSNGTSGLWSQVATNLPNSGKYQWALPLTPSNDSCFKVGAIDTQGNAGSDVCDATFKILPGNAPPYLNIVSPAGGDAWRSTKDVIWQGADVNKNTVTYNVNISSNGGNTWNLINTSTYTESASIVQHSFSLDTTKYSDGISYQIKTDVNDHNGSAVTKVTTNFTIDNTLPKSSMLPLAPYSKSVSFLVNWSGSDATSGIDHYDIYDSVDQGKFAKWITTANASETFNGQEGHRYCFYSISFDKAGNSEIKSIEEACTRIDATPPKTNVAPLPKYVNSTVFDVAYDVVDASSTNVTLYYRTELGTWTAYGNFSKSPISFTSQGEGIYEFYTEGVDAAGNKESKSQTTEAMTTVDVSPPTTVLTLKLPPSKLPIYNTSDIQMFFDTQDNYEILSVKILFGKSSDNSTWGAWLEGFAYPGGGVKSIQKSGTVKLQGEGFYRLKSGMIDGANNTEKSTTMVFLRIDMTLPQMLNLTLVEKDRNVSITFSEPMDRANTEKAFSILNYTGTIDKSWSSDSSMITLKLAGLIDNTTYMLTVSSMARDLAGNRLKRTDISFTTIPTRGGVLGKIISNENVLLKNVSVVLEAENGTKMAETTTDINGMFRFDDILAGNYTVLSNASGYIPAESKVIVIAGMSVFVSITLMKNNSTLYLIIATAIGILLFFLFLFFLVENKKRRKCPQCGIRVKKKIKICQKCGAHIPRYQTAIKSKTKLKKGKKIKTKGTEVKAMPAFGPDIHTAPKVMKRCPKCNKEVPESEDWCPKCGAMVATTIPELLPEIDMSQPNLECPRCYATLETGSKFCAVCGGNIEKFSKKMMQKEERIAEMKADAIPGAKIDLTEKKSEAPKIPTPPKAESDQPSPIPEPRMMPSITAPMYEMPSSLELRCKACNSSIPADSKWCDICGEKVYNNSRRSP